MSNLLGCLPLLFNYVLGQENRIKLMLANAKRIAAEEKKQQASTPVQ